MHTVLVQLYLPSPSQFRVSFVHLILRQCTTAPEPTLSRQRTLEQASKLVSEIKIAPKKHTVNNYTHTHIHTHTHTHTHTTATTTIDSCQKWPRRSPKGGTVREVRGEVGSASNGAPGPVASETGVDYRLGNDVQSAGDQSL